MIDRVFQKNDSYAEEFFKYVGAHDVHSFDNSNYEGAMDIHDLNSSVPPRYHGKYTVVCDGGSLEHVFNFPMAIKNCMEMVAVGGHFLGITPANNFMGHGFYQFSPELFCSVFNRDNGFELIRLIAFEDRANAEWYSVRSPSSIDGRVTLTNSRPVYLLVIAKRIEAIPPLTSMPQQSDYVSAWTSRASDGEAPSARPGEGLRSRILETAKRTAPRSIKRIAKGFVQSYHRHWHGGFDPRFFQPIERAGDSRIQERPH
jgi:hypothetical protein